MGLSLSLIAYVLALGTPASAQTILLDAVLASVEDTIVTASDIGLARGLDLFRFHPSEAPILPADVERFVDVQLVEREAARLDLQAVRGPQSNVPSPKSEVRGPRPPTTDTAPRTSESDRPVFQEEQTAADEVDAAWRAGAARVGGEAALTAWLHRIGIDPAWARRMLEADLRWRRFIGLRFRSFAFVSEAEVTEALGSGPHTEEERQRVRNALRTAAAQRGLAAWLQEARARATIRYGPLGPNGIPMPFPMPAQAGQASGYPSKP